MFLSNHQCQISDRSRKNKGVAGLGRKEGNVLFNDTFNTFYIWLYGMGYMVKDHSARKRKPTYTNTWAILFN